jgi:hypothetical protein
VRRSRAPRSLTKPPRLPPIVLEHPGQRRHEATLGLLGDGRPGGEGSGPRLAYGDGSRPQEFSLLST